MEVKSFLTGNRGVSLPFTDLCPLIISNENSFKLMFDAAMDLGRKNKWKTVEFRNNLNSSNLAPCTLHREPMAYSLAPCTVRPEPLAYSLQPSASQLPGLPAFTSFITHDLKLKMNPEDIFCGFRDSTRRNIKKAEKKGVRVEICQSLDAVKSFYRLNCATRKNHGLPPQPFRFFDAIFRHILSAGKGIVVLASHLKRIIAGAVYFHFRDSAVFKYGASDKTCQHLRPNNLVMWEAIKWYAQKGYQNLHFGRTDREHEGLLQFKRGWGAAEGILNYYTYDLNQNAFIAEKAFRTSYPLLKITPLPLLKLAGRLLYRHVG